MKFKKGERYKKNSIPNDGESDLYTIGRAIGFIALSWLFIYIAISLLGLPSYIIIKGWLMSRG